MIFLYLQLLFIGVPLLLLARLGRIYPKGLLVVLAIAPLLLSILLMAFPAAFLAAIALDIAVVAAAIIDLFTLPRKGTFAIERSMGRIASLKKDHRVELTITNSGPRERVVRVKDSASRELNATPEEHFLRLAPRSRTTVHYTINSSRRGAFTLDVVYLRVTSRMMLWRRFFDCPARSVLHVYPDMKQISEYAMLARTNRLSLVGVRRTRKIGQDNEFERLRDYTRDDHYKHIDWRSTARRRKLTVKEFQLNQSQRIVFLLDCGRMMTNQAGGLSLLDHALNAMLMLSYVALSQGDAVGLICFSDTIHGFVPPKTGMNQMNRLLHASFDRFPSLVESRYDQAFLYLNNHCRRRSLVILVSNIIDEVNSHQMQQYLGNIVGKHLPLSVLLRDRRIFEAADAAHPHGKALYRAAAAAEILTWRHQVIADQNSKGVLSVDVFPEELTAPLVNRYLDIKARHLL